MLRARSWRASVSVSTNSLWASSTRVLGVLARGYSFTSRAGEARKAVRDAGELSRGDRVVTRFARGEAESVVDEVRGTGEE